jgi:hypothetical protein
VITVLTTAAIALQVILNKLLGTQMTTAEFINRIGGPLSVGIPLGVVWAYHGYWLYRHIEAIGEPVRQAGMKRVYYYILSAIGLGGTFIGVALLIKFMIDRFTGGYLVINEAVRSDLAQAISIILAWLPLWLVTWRAVEAEATTPGDTGDHARRSIVRKSYLYLALFAGVIGGMISAVALIFQLIKTALTRLGEAALLSTILNDLQLLILFALLLVYHLGVMRRDGRSAAAALAKKQAGFKVLVVDSGKGFAASIKAALAKTAPNVPVTVAARQPRGKYDAMILSGSRALDAPPWLRSYKGTRIVVPNEAKGLLWAGGISSSSIQKAALAVRQLAEGQSVQQKAAGPGWMIVIYIAASLFGIELIMMLVVTLISTFAGGGN